MNYQFGLICFAGILYLLQVVENASLSEAVSECGKVHDIESQSLSSVNASFSNAKCSRKCVIENVALPVDLINEGEHCPEDIVGFCRSGQCIGGQEDALRECGLKHGVDFHQTKIDPRTAFSNDQCLLRCVLGGVELSVNHKHEGSPCPANLNGVCRSGTCVVQSIDISTNTASTVTLPPTTVTLPPTTVTLPPTTVTLPPTTVTLPPSTVTLPPTTVTLPPTTVTLPPTTATLPPTTVTLPPTTVTLPPTTVTQPSIDSFSPSKLKLLNISLESTDLSLNQNQVLYLYFYETKQSNKRDILDFYGMSTSPNYYYFQNINDIPSKLKKDSQIAINFYSNGAFVAYQYEDIYSLFSTFYRNHKLAFGEKEDFVHRFPVHRNVSPNEKLMDVTLRFTIVFSKD